jgi:hypothetical protein
LKWPQFECYCLDGYCILFWNHTKQFNIISVWMYTMMALVLTSSSTSHRRGHRRGARRQRGATVTPEGAQARARRQRGAAAHTGRRRKGTVTRAASRGADEGRVPPPPSVMAPPRRSLARKTKGPPTARKTRRAATEGSRGRWEDRRGEEESSSVVAGRSATKIAEDGKGRGPTLEMLPTR